MPLKRVRIELARSPDFPDGSHRHGYEFILPFDAEGRLDLAEYERAPELATVHRFWEGEDDETGELIRSEDGGWAFSYEQGEDDDEPLYRFDEHEFREGEYLSLRGPGGGEAYTFHIVLVTDPPGLGAAAAPRDDDDAG
ncbi:MAG TPA: hypothetical protein VGD08_03745 [Stellaceae bacterium]